MQYNNKFTMQDLFMNKKLEKVLPQFKSKREAKKVNSARWVEEKVKSYIQSVLGGVFVDDTLIIKGKHAKKLKEIERLQIVLIRMFYNIEHIAQGVQKNIPLLLPIDSLEAISKRRATSRKLQLMEWVLENIEYNPDFENNIKKTPLHVKEQEWWLKKVGLL